jgi:hypothetical protein
MTIGRGDEYVRFTSGAAAAANQFAVGRRVPGTVIPAEMAALLTV